jgi:hypothetical protein
MNGRATLSNGRRVKKMAAGTVIVRASQENFEVMLKI